MSDAYLTETLSDIEKSIANEQIKVKLGKAFEDLIEDKNFELVIGEGFFKAYLEKSISIVTNTLVPESDEVNEALATIAGVNRLKEYLENIITEASYAKGRIEQDQDYRKRITLEASEGIDDE